MTLNNIDLLIVGAGPVGCVIAERAANVLGWKVLLVEKRHHIAGNCYDRFHESGLMIHQYGPHYFRTNKKELLDYLSQFTSWIPGNYFVKSFTQGDYFPFPINLNTLSQFFKKELNADTAKKLLEEVRYKIDNPQNSEEFVLSRVGKEMYEAFYLGYTLKQWALHPKELDASVCGRIPIRFNHDERYVDHEFQLTPANGFTALFSKMISNPNIHVMLQTDYRELQKWGKPNKATVYTGPIDEYFNHSLGKLPWRSLEFEFKTFNKEFVQPCVQINYPNDFDYTRTVEIKHVTAQKHHNTVISYEYSKATGDPYYPVPAPQNRELFNKYWQLAQEETRNNKVYFAGRLAKYLYMNTDEAIESALEQFEIIKNDTSAHQ
jgi:UDP-galactopyranose mutase